MHVFVKGKWRGQAEAITEIATVQVGTLSHEDRITALQTLCTKISDQSVPVSVTLGRLWVVVKPETIVKCPNPQNVTVIVDDADYLFPVPATVHMPGATFPANTPFAWTFAAGQLAPASSVGYPDYASAPVTWNVQEPAQPPPPPPRRSRRS